MPLIIKVREEEEPTPAPAEDIKINIEDPPEEEEEAPSLKMNLRARKSLDGSILISDHYVIDIAVIPDSMKVAAFPKNSYTDEVYTAQNRLFEHLTKAGIVDRESIQSGAVHGSMEGIIQKSASDVPPVDVTVLSIGKFLEKEKPEYMFLKAYDDEIDDMYTEPDEEDSTRLGEVPQEEFKGSVLRSPVYNYLGSRV
jgi:hypothetical protein